MQKSIIITGGGLTAVITDENGNQSTTQSALELVFENGVLVEARQPTSEGEAQNDGV